MSALFVIVAAFLAAAIEGIEMMAVLVGVGATRGWRSTLLGAVAGFCLLGGLTVGLGDALLAIPIQALRLVVGSLLLVLGLQWLKKALLRIGRPHVRRHAAGEDVPPSHERIDWYAFVIAFKTVMLEGLEVVFIVVTFGAEAHQVGRAAAGAGAALAAVGGVAFLGRRWLSRIPREWLRFAIGVILSAFGTFWAGEGVRVGWPGGDWFLPGLLAGMTAVAFAYLTLLRSGGAGLSHGDRQDV